MPLRPVILRDGQQRGDLLRAEHLDLLRVRRLLDLSKDPGGGVCRDQPVFDGASQKGLKDLSVPRTVARDRGRCSMVR